MYEANVALKNIHSKSQKWTPFAKVYVLDSNSQEQRIYLNSAFHNTLSPDSGMNLSGTDAKAGLSRCKAFKNLDKATMAMALRKRAQTAACVP